MRFLLSAFVLIASCVTAAAQGCGPSNPNCIVPTAPANTNDNRAASTAFVQQAIGGPAVNVVHGPGSSTVGDVSVFNNTSGNLLSDAGGGIPSNPLVHPSSGNLLCTSGHNAWWVDQNICTTADVMNWVSSDPSAIFQATVGGSSFVNGDTINVKFEFGSGACQAGTGCTATANIVNTDTVTTATAKIVAAIKANANLFTSPNGGYGSGAQIGFVTNTAGALALDFNSAVAMKVTSTITGTGNETFTISTTNCGTACTAALDNNPVIETGRNTGAAPVAGSVISGRQISGTTSASPSSIAATYAGENVYVDNSTTGSLAGHWCWYTTSTTGANVCRLLAGLGVYTNSVADKGADSFNALSYWLNGTWEFLLTSGNVDLASGATHFHFNTDGSLDLTNASTTSIGLKLGGNLVAAQDGTFTYLINPASAAFLQSQNNHNFYSANTHTFQNTVGNQTALTIINGAYLGAPTGTDEGLGTLNLAGGLFNNGTAPTGTGAYVRAASPSFSGTVTMPDSGTWTSSGIASTAINSTSLGATTPSSAKVTSLNASGQITSTTGLPTIASGACGATTNGAVVSGSTNQSGQITIGSAATTTCTISWSATLAVVPNACVFFPMNATAAATGTTVARVGAPTNTNVVLTGSALANANYAYICL